MATVDEILTRQAYAAGDETWTKDNNYPSYTMYAEPEYVPVTNKRIADFNDQVSVRGEQNAQFVGFQLPRYDDAMDLSTQNLYIHYQTVYGGSDGVPCNVSWSDNYVRLCWMIPGQATQEPGSIQMMIYATGTDSTGDRTIWKTLPATYTIHDGLEIGGGIPEPDPSWYEQFVAQMEGKVSTAQGYANDAQASKVAAAGSATAAAQSADASAQALAENKDYVESQKETFVGYNKRETDLKYANALIGSASGTGRVTVGDAWDAPIPDLRISGESEQVSTTGAQLLQDSNIYPGFLTNANGTRTNDNNYRTVWLSLPIGTYTLSVPGEAMIVKTVIDGILNNSSTSIADGAGYTCTLTQDGFLGISFRKQDSSDYTEEPQVMLNTGSTALPWEPYTGGKPSPSPDYPQPISGTGTVTTGAQLFDASRIPNKSTGGTTVTNKGDGSFTVAGDGSLQEAFGNTISLTHEETIALIKEERTFTVYSNVAVYPYFFFNFYDKNGTVKLLQLTGVTKVTESIPNSADMDTLYIKFGYYGMAGEAIVAGNQKVMVNAGSAALPWEPYTGGKPSPSAEYPQPLDVTVTGAQLINPDTRNVSRTTCTVIDDRIKIVATDDTGWQNVRLYVGPAEKYAGKKLYLRIAGISGGTTASRAMMVWTNNNTASISAISTYQKSQFGTWLEIDVPSSIPDTANALTLCLCITEYRNNASYPPVGTEAIFEQVILSESIVDWQPYQSKTATIQLTAPLHGIGEYRDRIMCRDGVWGIERNILLDKLTSSSVSASSGGVTTSNNVIDNRYTVITCEAWKNIIKKDLYENGKKTIGICTIAQPGMINDWNTSKNGKENVYTINAAGAMYISIPISPIGITADATRAEVTAAVKQYVTDHDVYVAFVLSTPTWEPLPSATQSALNALTTFTGTTHVIITSGGPEPDVAVEYVQDTRAVIADLQAQINAIRNGGTT